MKISTALVAFKNVFILLWMIAVLIIFKIVNNFEFENGESLIFISLLVLPPLVIYLLFFIYKKRKINKKNILRGPYFTRILNDIKNNTFKKQFLNKLNLILKNVIVNETSDSIIVCNNDIEIDFNKDQTLLKLLDTNIEYIYHYSSKVETSAYLVYKNLKYKSTLFLYKNILEKIEELTSGLLEYKENKYGMVLTLVETGKIIFNSVPKKKDKKFSIIKQLNLKN